MRKTQWTALLAAAALTLALLAGCGGQDNNPPPAPDPTPATSEADDEKTPPVSDPVPPPKEDEQSEDASPVETEPVEEEDKSEGETVDIQPDEPAPDPEEPPAEPEPDAEPAPEAGPAPDPEPEPGGETIIADGTYTISVTLAGGSGRATVESPAKLRYENGTCWATIVWSSSNYDYMKVDGQRYDPINTEGNSTFEIPVSAFDQPLAVIADTIAMSEPHEIEYTLTFDSASMQDA